ncbi:hypothetical protein AGABI1DRAFT_134636 [Agaricus bisporus var. burnettii JB137-S8]|uniref:Uncharacterized protein n=1 Tax=Agaricus bisporus var. burnettii (strain JB137-S8 / ATCC MYA-4627 / FGSC 10392) TaxID=597362 RepID=K5WRY5_AGABU|nr:uncharacterized protein AGABI1DRAFT_134636 [Agaricus bisporus var. burnettii JB137-S8]EKM73508.1 hypothetical protein AGABI1DRAFT_134636 [Agaricus bisporus var. burnettii JB137-S8]
MSQASLHQSSTSSLQNTPTPASNRASMLPPSRIDNNSSPAASSSPVARFGAGGVGGPISMREGENEAAVYNEHSGLGLGFQSAELPTMKHAGEDLVVGMGIHPSIPLPPDSLANEQPAGATNFISPDPPMSRVTIHRYIWRAH